MTNQSLGELAWEHWASYGMPVFPCLANKRPATKHGFKDAVTDYDEVIALFNASPNASKIGVATGGDTGIFVLDFDTYKDGGQQYKEALENGQLLPPTRVHRTGSGGLHYFYRYSEGEDIRNSAPHAGAEVRGTGGYVIVPPSPGYEVISSARIAEAPTGLLRRLRAASGVSSSATNEQLETAVIQADSFHEALVVLVARAQANGETREETLDYALGLLRSSSAKEPTHPRHDRWAKLMRDDGREVSRIVTSAYGKYNPDRGESGLRKTRKKEPQPEPEQEDDTEPGRPYAFERSYTLKEVETLDDDKGFLLFPIIQHGDVVLVAAGPKAGKTLFVLNMCLSAAVGVDFGDIVPMDNEGSRAPVPVVYFALESQGAIRQRVRAWTRNATARGVKIDPEEVPLLVVEKSFDFTNSKTKQYIADQLVKHDQELKAQGFPGVQLVVIDTLTKAMPGKDQNSVEDTSAVFEITDYVRDVGLNPAIIYLHHNKQDDSRPRGSSNILAEPDTVLSLKQEEAIVDGAQKSLLDASVYMARSITDTWKQKYMFEQVSLGINHQNLELNSAVLVPVKVATIPYDKNEEAIRERMEDARALFFMWLASSVLALNNANDVEELDKYIRGNCPEDAKVYYLKYRKKTVQGRQQTWAFIAADYDDPSSRLIYDSVTNTITLAVYDASGASASAQAGR